jgi:hypothetical protein
MENPTDAIAPPRGALATSSGVIVFLDEILSATE